MIKRKFQTYSNGEPYGEPWHKEFKDEEEMRQWQRSQDGHPWMDIERVLEEDEDLQV